MSELNPVPLSMAFEITDKRFAGVHNSCTGLIRQISQITGKGHRRGVGVLQNGEGHDGKDVTCLMLCRYDVISIKVREKSHRPNRATHHAHQQTQTTDIFSSHTTATAPNGDLIDSPLHRVMCDRKAALNSEQIKVEESTPTAIRWRQGRAACPCMQAAAFVVCIVCYSFEFEMNDVCFDESNKTVQSKAGHIEASLTFLLFLLMHTCMQPTA